MFILLFALAWLPVASPEGSIDPQLDDRVFYAEGRGRIPYAEVERIALNHTIGSYRGGPLNLSNFVPLGQRTFLGLDDDQHLVQVLDLKTHVVAFPLAGERKVRAFFLLEQGPLFVLGANDELLVFERHRWDQSPVAEITQLHGRRLGRAAVVLGGFVFASASSGVFDLTLNEWVGAVGATSFGFSFLTGFLALQDYDQRNLSPDGLRTLGRTITGYTDFEPVGHARDILLHGSNGVTSLRQVADEVGVLNEPAKLFDLDCAAYLLPGVPPPEPRPEDFD